MRVTRRQFLKRASLAVGCLAGVDGFAVEPGWLRVVRLDRTDLGLGKTIVHFSDVHHSGNRGYFERVVAVINAQCPDLVFFTGDLVNAGETRHLAEALEVCGQIRAPLYGVSGNHDPWDQASLAALAKVFAATGGAWMINQAIDLGSFVLHASSWNRPFGRPESRTKILLCHYPAACEHALEQPYDMILSGHSHGGQALIPLLGPVYLPRGTGRYVRGEYDTPSGKLFVSAGIGTTGIRVRFMCRPDIAVIRT